MLIFFFAEVHPFGSVTAEPIAVDIVSPKEAAEWKLPETPTYEIPPKPEIQIPNITDLPTEAKAAAAAKSAAAAAPPPPPPPPATASQSDARQQKQAAQQSPHSAQQQAAAQQQPSQQQQQPPSQPQPQAQPQPQPPPEPQQLASIVPPAIPQEPDVTVKYHVSLGLPTDTPGGDFDAPASKAADVSSNLVTEFRRHLKTCSKLPASVSPADDVKIKMRISMTPDGKLIGEPILVEASASTKGPLLMRSAMNALQTCQPYSMLPPDRYREWRSLDLVFTPRDFIGG